MIKKSIILIGSLAILIFLGYSIHTGIVKYNDGMKNMANNIILLEENMKIIARNVVSLQKSRELETSNLKNVLSDFGIRISSLEDQNINTNAKDVIQTLSRVKKDLQNIDFILANSGCAQRFLKDDYEADGRLDEILNESRLPEDK